MVVNPGEDLTPLAVNNLGEDAYATPAFADGRIYVRTVAALYAFGRQVRRERDTRVARAPERSAPACIDGAWGVPCRAHPLRSPS